MKLGLVAAMSGQSAKSGEAIVRGLSLAIDEINAKGGVLGKKVELLVRDEALADRSIKQGTDLCYGLVLGDRCHCLRWLPVPTLSRPPVAPDKYGGGLELADTRERIEGGRHVPEAQIERDRGAIG